MTFLSQDLTSDQEKLPKKWNKQFQWKKCKQPSGEQQRRIPLSMSCVQKAALQHIQWIWQKCMNNEYDPDFHNPLNRRRRGGGGHQQGHGRRPAHQATNEVRPLRQKAEKEAGLLGRRPGLGQSLEAGSRKQGQGVRTREQLQTQPGPKRLRVTWEALYKINDYYYIITLW